MLRIQAGKMFKQGFMCYVLLASSAWTLVALASPQGPKLTLEQAVARAQEESGGTVLSASQQNRERRTVYWIKVLTPDGHVKTMVIPAEAVRASSFKETTNSPAVGVGNKEKH